MSQELIYKVRFKEDQGDLLNIRKELEKLGKDTGAGVKTDPSTIKESTRQFKEQNDTLKQLRNTLKEYQKALAETQREAREQGTATESNIKVQRALGTAINETKTQIESASRGNLDYNTSLTQSGNSLREMKGQLRALKIAIDNVEDPLGKGKDRVAELTAEAGRLNKQIGEVEKEMGVFSRNVGNYSSANDGLVTSLRGTANALAIVQGPLGPIAGRVNSLATSISRFRQANDVAAVSATKLGVAIKAGLIASGVGLLIVSLGSLLAFFKRTEKGQQQLRVITAALSAVFETFADRASALGERLFEAFSNPREAVANLWESVKTFRDAFVEDFMSRVRAVPELFGGVFDRLVGSFKVLGAEVKLALSNVPILGDFIDTEKAEEQLKEGLVRVTEGIKRTGEAIDTIFTPDRVRDFFAEASSGAKNLLKDIKDNARENMRNAREMNSIMERERDLLIRRAKMDRDMAQVREDARDLSISEEQRLLAIAQIREQEKALMEDELKLERERLQVMQEQDDRFNSREEHLMALAEQQAKIFKMEEDHSKAMMSLLRDETSIERQLRERNMRQARMEFDIRMGWKNLEIEMEAQKLERMGRMLEAERLRLEESEVDHEVRKGLRIAQLQAEFRNQKFSAEEAAQMAHNQWELEEAQRVHDAKTRLDELEVQAKVQQLQLLGKMIGAFNQAFFNDNKALAAASTIVNTYAGIVAALGATPWGPQNYANAAIVGMQGFANVRRILATNLNSTSVDSSASQVSAPTPSFGLVDLPGLGADMASQQPPSIDMQPNIILEGEFDPEFLSVKVRQGNDKISGNTLGIGI